MTEAHNLVFIQVLLLSVSLFLFLLIFFSYIRIIPFLLYLAFTFCYLSFIYVSPPSIFIN
jgi:hypothetical protein